MTVSSRANPVNGVTKRQAQQIWSSLQEEMDARLLAVRPKFTSYEAHMILQHARQSLIDNYPTMDEVALKALALSHFIGLPYMKTSKFYVPTAATLVACMES